MVSPVVIGPYWSLNFNHGLTLQPPYHPPETRCLQDQMQVPELVPEVALFQGLPVGDPEVAASGYRFEQPEVGGARLVQAGEHRAHGPDAAFGRDDLAGPSFSGVRRAVGTGHGLQGPHDRGAAGHPPPDRVPGPAAE